MSGSVNRVFLIGNLGRDPEVRQLPSGDNVVSLSVATSKSWKDKTGNRQEKTIWHKVSIFNDRLGEISTQYLHKGSKVYLEGELDTRTYVGKDGVEREVTEIVLGKFRGEMTLLDSKESGATQSRSPDTQKLPARGNIARTAALVNAPLDDDVPY